MAAELDLKGFALLIAGKLILIMHEEWNWEKHTFLYFIIPQLHHIKAAYEAGDVLVLVIPLSKLLLLLILASNTA